MYLLFQTVFYNVFENLSKFQDCAQNNLEYCDLNIALLKSPGIPQIKEIRRDLEEITQTLPPLVQSGEIESNVTISVAAVLKKYKNLE